MDCLIGMKVFIGEEFIGYIAEANSLFFSIQDGPIQRTVRRKTMSRALRLRVIRVPAILIAAQLL